MGRDGNAEIAVASVVTGENMSIDTSPGYALQAEIMNSTPDTLRSTSLLALYCTVSLTPTSTSAEAWVLCAEEDDFEEGA